LAGNVRTNPLPCALVCPWRLPSPDAGRPVRTPAFCRRSWAGCYERKFHSPETSPHLAAPRSGSRAHSATFGSPVEPRPGGRGQGPADRRSRPSRRTPRSRRRMTPDRAQPEEPPGSVPAPPPFAARPGVGPGSYGPGGGSYGPRKGGSGLLADGPGGGSYGRAGRGARASYGVGPGGWGSFDVF